MTKGKLTFLGTGASMGIPMIGCTCEVCRSADPHNKRLRPSAIVEFEGRKFLIDAGPDFRTQMLRSHTEMIDGLLITHSHYDHTAAIDELRAFYFLKQNPLPILLSPPSEADIKRRFYYIFAPAGKKVLAKLEFHILPCDRGTISFCGVPITYFTFFQAEMPITGFKIGKLAYISDISEYPPTIFEDLFGIETLVVSALQMEPSVMHFSIDQAIEFSQKTGAKKTWITHISHALDHEKTNKYLPSNIYLAYDDLEFEF